MVMLLRLHCRIDLVGMVYHHRRDGDNSSALTFHNSNTSEVMSEGTRMCELQCNLTKEGENILTQRNGQLTLPQFARRSDTTNTHGCV